MTAMRPTLRAINHMHEAATKLAERAESRDMRQTARQVRNIARNLDATRTALVQEGPEYTETAAAILYAAADRLAAHAVWIGRCTERGRRFVELADGGALNYGTDHAARA